MITRPDIFEGELSIGQITQPDVAARVQWFINKYEPLYLAMLLGKDLAEKLEAEYAKEQHEDKWTKLADKVRPMLAGYIYFYYRLDEDTIATGVGEVSEQSENATRATPSYKMVKAWNDMARDSVDFLSWIDRSIYPEYGGYRLVEIYGTRNTFGLGMLYDSNR